MSTPPRRIGAASALRHAAGQRDGVGLVDVLADDDELVAAEAGDQVAGAHGGAQPVGHLDEQLVAGGVAERVVDDLEVVEVEEEAGQAAGAGRNRSATYCASSVRLGSPVSGSWLAWWASLASKASRSVMSSMVPTKPAPTPGVNRWAKRMTVVRTAAVVADQAGLGLDLVAVEGGGDLLDDAVQVVLVDGVDPAGAEQLLGPAGRPGCRTRR